MYILLYVKQFRIVQSLITLNFSRLFGYPFFDAPNASEILKVNRKFTAEFEAIATVKQELKNPSSKISKEGMLTITSFFIL